MKKCSTALLLTLLLCLPGCGAAAPAGTPIEKPDAAPTPAVSASPIAPEASEIHRVLTDAFVRQDDEVLRDTLAALETVDPELGGMWRRILDYWTYVNGDMPLGSALPDNLPADDSLCLVVLGYRLEPDGEMAPELIARCELALAAAAQYPEAYVLLTGGPTALPGTDPTEAGRMAQWLKEHGVAPERLLVEDRALSTGENAVFSLALLRECCPQVQSLCILSSDYHVPLGSLLFFAQGERERLESGLTPLTVLDGAGCAMPERQGILDVSAQAAFLRALMSD